MEKNRDDKAITLDSWDHLGFLFKPDQSFDWSKSHAMLPTPLRKSDGYRVFYSGRNRNNQSSIGWFDLNFKDEQPVVTNSSLEPVLVNGELGAFDDNGVSPSCVIELPSGDLALYYIGWNPGSTTRVNLFGGLALSDDGGASFSRWSRAPILERTKQDPLINTAPWVIKNKDSFYMYYVSGIEWKNKNSPRYNIKIAFSHDGINWDRPGKVVLDFLSPKETALARPFVTKEDDVWKMWITKRIGEYSIGYAESLDGINWQRKDSVLGLNPSNLLGEKKMVEYGVSITSTVNRWLLYNGDDYGKMGVLIAKQKL